VPQSNYPTMSAITFIERLDKHRWKTSDPFLFCSHHKNSYPSSSEPDGDSHSDLGPPARALAGRNLGEDFSELNGFSMYYGKTVPGYPRHLHYGCEIITIVKEGVLDHFDSIGGKARLGTGDVLWLTACGNGISHSQMFPLLNYDSANEVEFITIWLNMSANKRMSADASSRVIWREDQPKRTFDGPTGRQSSLRVIAGSLANIHSNSELLSSNSYAADPQSELVIAIIKIEPEGTFEIPAASSGRINRVLYILQGSKLELNGKEVDLDEAIHMITLSADQIVLLKNTSSNGKICEILILQGQPLKEPLFQCGPYVASTNDELMNAMGNADNVKWPYIRSDPVHSRHETRFFQLNQQARNEPCAGQT
jgi:redox-sensitive bicupin YhaK (pirin superfamily)